MANKQIQQYTAALTIDGANDLLLEYQNSSGVYKSISRNTFLGVSGTPADLSTIQTFTNKVVGNTNTITVKDTLFSIQDDGDATKVANFQLSGITTGNTRTLTVPDASGTLTLNAATQTLTNKTITSPTITGGTIDNSSITVDSISGHSTSTIVTVGGVQMNNGTIGTSGAVITASIAAGAVVPNSLQASSGTGWAYQNWTPVFTSWTIGTGGSSGTVAKYTQIGKTVVFYLHSILGTSGESVGSNPSFTLPVTASTGVVGAGATPIGNLVAVSAGTIYAGQLWAQSTTSGLLIFLNSSATYLTTAAGSSTVPNTWTANDRIDIVGSYEAA